MRDTRKWVSIVLPTHNGARYLGRAIESCLEQTYSRLQLVIVDDGSTDETKAIVGAYDDERIILVSLPENQGLSRALNAGFQQAAADFLTWTSDDNYYAPQALEYMVNFLQAHPEIDFVYTDYLLIDEHDRVLESCSVLPPEQMLAGNGVGACFLYRRRVYEVLGGYNPACGLAEDYEYWLRVLGRFRMKPLHQPLYFYRKHSRSLTGRHLGRVWRAKWRVQRQWLPRLPGVSKQVLAKTYLSLAYEARINNAEWEALRWLMQAIGKAPALVLSPEVLGRMLRRMGWPGLRGGRPGC